MQLLLCLVSASISHGFESIDPTVEAALRQCNDGFRIISCRVSSTTKSPETAAVKAVEGFMIKTPTEIRFYVQGNSRAEDRRMVGTTVSMWMRAPDGKLHGQIRPMKEAGLHRNEADILSHAHLRVVLSSGTIVDLADFLNDPTYSKVGTWKAIEGERRYIVTYCMKWDTKPPTESEIELQLSSKHNFLPIEQRTTTEYRDNSGKAILQKVTSRIEEFVELAPGRYFPAKCHVKVETGDKVSYESTTTASQISERPEDLNAFPPFQFPLDTEVTDHIQRQFYRVLANGQHEPVTKDGKPVIRVWEQAQADEFRTPAQQQILRGSQLGPTGFSEPPTWPWWTLVSCVAMAAVGALWYWRSRHFQRS